MFLLRFLLSLLLLLAVAIRFYDGVWVFSYARQFPRRVLSHRPYLVLDLRKLRVCLHFNWHTSSERTCALFRFYTLRISFQWNWRLCVCVFSVSLEHTQSICRLEQLQNRKPRKKINGVQKKQLFGTNESNETKRTPNLIKKRSVEIH